MDDRRDERARSDRSVKQDRTDADTVTTKDTVQREHVTELSKIRTQMFAMLACFAILVAPFIYIAVKTALRAEDNTDKIADVERADRIATFRASWRGCARDMLERADQRVSDAAVAELPGIRALIPEQLIIQSVQRREMTLPILNCDPNLCGDGPYGLSPAEQRRFVALYAAGQMDPIPEPPKRQIACPAVGPPLQMR